MPDIVLLISYVLIGVLAGLSGGLLGLGGGIVIVPAFLLLFAWQGFALELQMSLAVATSLATIVFTAASATWAHHQRGAVRWDLVLWLAPGMLLGAVCGAWLADSLPGSVHRVLFGVFEMLAGLYLLRRGRSQYVARERMRLQMLPAAGGGIGLLSALMGIGGGTVTVPVLLYQRVKMHHAVAASSACGLPIALSGCLSMVWLGWHQPGLPAYCLGYVYWPAVLAVVAGSIGSARLGVLFAHRLPEPALRRVFAVVLLLIGLQMVL